jgi:hypothetical protein
MAVLNSFFKKATFSSGLIPLATKPLELFNNRGRRSREPNS